MKFPASFLLLSILGDHLSPVNGMPTLENVAKGAHSGQHRESKRCPYADLQDEIQGHLNKRLLFDPLTTPIDVSGDHAFQAPNFDAGDQRGPCPGLNALANHGYIPRNGVTGMAEVIAAINEVFGIGTVLATILAVMGTVWVGNPLSLDHGFSIGGATSKSQNILGNLLGLLGTPQGLIGSHNLIESDSSNTRNDLYVTGDAATLQMDLFMEWYNMSDTNYTMDMMAERAQNRLTQSKAENPYFYYGPVNGLISRNAGYLFAGRLMRNHSSENLEGVLTPSIIKSFFGVYGDEEEGSFEYRKGQEQIPKNWYKTPVDYDIMQLSLDLVDWIRKYPELASIGGNTGTVNSFVGIDLGNLTGGVFNLDNLLEGNNLLCFVFQVVKFVSPDAISPLYSTLEVPLNLLDNALASPLLDLACPALKDLEMGGKPYWDAVQDIFPGARKSGGAF